MVIFILFTFILLYILVSISLEDIKTMLISENKLRIYALNGLLYLICLGLSNKKINILEVIIGNAFSVLIIFIIMYLIKYISYKLFKTNSLGLGDIKLSSYTSIWLGFELTFLPICISFLLSALYSLSGKITKRLKPFHQYPFAPFLSIGIFSSWLSDKI